VAVTPDNPALKDALAGKIQWSIDSIPGAVLTWQNGGTSSTGVGVYQTSVGGKQYWTERAIFDKPPASNSDFGLKNCSYTVQDWGHTEQGSLKIFYSANGTNHPAGGSPVTPNWYYYYSQTSANSGTPTYGGPDAALCGKVPFRANELKPGEQIGAAYIYDPTSPSSGGSCGYFTSFRSRTGIDKFASVVRHEGRHREYFYSYWNPYLPLLDADQDNLRDDTETNLVSMTGGHYEPTLTDTDGDGVNDGEDYASTAEQGWTDGSADSEDWAESGNQWKQGFTNY